jgi:hypothetical protein
MRWQQKRLEILNRDGWKCRSCGAEGEGVTLNVHHAYYERDKDPWDYEDHLLVTWCEYCHSNIHHTVRLLMKRLAGDNGFEMLGHALGYVDGLLENFCNDHPAYNHGYVACVKAKSMKAATVKKIIEKHLAIKAGAL